ncbi:hypothetical protein Tco_0703424 [Tanacetum coccineum]|uniref:Uncharacterized protein n=1 Tax=Tanacetum coccineum TaxID=301880 RepID=A0ABQ4Y0C1_9ASTR
MKKEKRDKPKEVYSDSTIIEVIRTSYELGHEHKFITGLIVRRANGKIVPITKPYYKYLNKNDIEDLYLLYINGKVDNYIETRLLGSLTVFIRSTVIWERVHDFQLGIESTSRKSTLLLQQSHSLLLKNMNCLPSPMNRLKKYNKDVKYGYVDPCPSDANVEYLRYYGEDIEDILKHRDQMRRWEMYVNGRLLGSRRDHPE